MIWRKTKVEIQVHILGLSYSMNIEILGSRGSGKTTLGKSLSSELDIQYVSVGEIARGEMTNGTPIGKQMQHYIDTKQLYPAGFLTNLIQDRLHRAIESKSGFILDGYPRHHSEANELVGIMYNLQANLDFIIGLDLPLKTIKERVARRLICTSCDYQDIKIAENPSHSCLNCNQPLEVRRDDTDEEIERAFNLYRTQKTQILDVLTPITLYGVINLDGKNEHGYLLNAALVGINEILNPTE